VDADRRRRECSGDRRAMGPALPPLLVAEHDQRGREQEQLQDQAVGVERRAAAVAVDAQLDQLVDDTADQCGAGPRSGEPSVPATSRT
jgi:hypothetical protein